MRGQRGRITTKLYGVVSRQSHVPTTLYSLHFIYPSLLMLSSDTPWHLTRDRISRTEIKRTLCMPASHGRGLNNNYCWLSQAKANKQIDTPGSRVMQTAESVSVPYSNPMSDVLSISRCYRCLITDVYIGHSLVISVFVSVSF